MSLDFEVSPTRMHMPITLRTIAESPHEKAPVNKKLNGGFWLLFVDRHRRDCYRW